MKDWYREMTVAISVIMAPNRGSCVVQRFKDVLEPIDSLRYSMIIARCVSCYDPHLQQNQRDMMFY